MSFSGIQVTGVLTLNSEIRAIDTPIYIQTQTSSANPDTHRDPKVPANP